ncbi:uncharacterized protein VTP21DRAFT_10607 [Calcarisporiella thermophila]|uniref:uncharacterized protein n=1 Tax=Calcarisporiella thermophila TaxID=911321 RepID=UPI00374226CB
MASGNLEVRVICGRDMKNQEIMGKQDPYTKLGFDVTGKELAKTQTHRAGGQNPQWNQNFNFNVYPQNSELFVEVWDEEAALDDLIGFCAIPLDQVYRNNGYMNAWFEIFLPKGYTSGEINLILIHQNQQPQNTGYGPVKGYSYMNPQHLQRMKSSEKRKVAAEVGAVGLGGALAVGAGFLVNKIIQDQRHAEDEKRHQEEEAARLQQEAEQRRQQEELARRQQLDEERRRFEQEKQQWSQQQHQSQTSPQYQQHQGGGDFGGVKHYGGGHGAREWDPVGTYAMGDRVSYHGRTYVCLQGHTSNPTWMPGTYTCSPLTV